MFVKKVILEGHILDSLTLSKILDHILKQGGHYELLDLDVGHRPADTSNASLCILADDPAKLNGILDFVRGQGGKVPEESDVTVEPAPADGVFPEGFYATTNLETFVRLNGEEIQVKGEAMDLGITVSRKEKQASTVPMNEVTRGDLIVVGSEGITIVPLKRARKRGEEGFGFMKSDVSVERPRRQVVEEIAASLAESRKKGEKNLLVIGPAVVHSGASESVVKLIERGTFDVIFGGNAVAVHDIENCLYGTSLGITLKNGAAVYGGHQHHLRAINAIRSAGSIEAAIKTGLLTRGIMHAAFTTGVDVFLAGSIRDDGPLPGVCTDVLEAKKIMRQKLKGVGTAVMVATALHSIATGNLLKADVKTFCVDINPEAVTKLLDRGSLQTVPLVMDCESFFHELEELMP